MLRAVIVMYLCSTLSVSINVELAWKCFCRGPLQLLYLKIQTGSVRGLELVVKNTNRFLRQRQLQFAIFAKVPVFSRVAQIARFLLTIVCKQ